ncbi:hypothetical protein BGZ72_009689 [Mortierella alpina]|nr:hypothetical protein BGZ72_009689 [Mortierella alpina]
MSATYEEDILKRTESTLRRAQAADDYDGPTLYPLVLGEAKEISKFISAPTNAGLALALATEERVAWYDTSASHCLAMNPEEAEHSSQKWTGDFFPRVGAVDSKGALVPALRRCTGLCKAPGAKARTHCEWAVFEGRSYPLLQQTRTCSEEEMRDYIATFLAGSLCVGYMYATGRALTGLGARGIARQDGIIPTPTSRLGFLMRYMLDDDVRLDKSGLFEETTALNSMLRNLATTWP